jgi:putative endopeptidase
MKKTLSFLLVFVIMISLIPSAAAAELAASALPMADQTASTAPATMVSDSGPLTRGELTELLITAADACNTAEASDIIKGDEQGQLRYDDPVTRLEALVMLTRAFGELPEPSANLLFAALADTGVGFSDIPAWARQDVNALIAAGILVNTEDGLLHAGEYITEEEALTLLRRMWMLFGSGEKDDFYMTHEKESTNNARSVAGYAGRGAVYDVIISQNERTEAILAEILAGQWEAGSDEQKIKDYYEAALSVCSGAKSDLSPIRGYLDALSAAESISGLLEVIYDFYAETGLSISFLTPEVDPDLADSTKNVLWLVPDTSPLDADTYGDSTVYEAAKKYIEELLVLGGESRPEAAAAATDIAAYRKSLSAVQVAPENQYDVDYLYNVMSLDDADAQLKNIDLGAMLTAFGYEAPDSLVISDAGTFRYLCDFLSEENLGLMKNIVKYLLLAQAGEYLSAGFYDVQMDFNDVLSGEKERKNTEERARDYVLSALSTEIGKQYVKRYFTQEEKDLLSQIEQEYVRAFREQIRGLGWMGAETKTQAIAKLESLTFKNIWPDYWFTDQESRYHPSYEVTAGADGGSFYSNSAAINRAYTEKSIASLGKAVDRAEWSADPIEVNAFYYLTENAVYLAAGFLADPLYSTGAGLETLLGSVGTIIGHEMTHAFDNNGAKFDANGNNSDWWSAQDYAAFENRCGRLAEMFDRFEAAPGIPANGRITLGENVADLGGLALSLKVAERMIREPDYKKIFEAYSHSRYQYYPRQSVSYLTSYEPHSMEWLRVNVPLMLTEEFYQAYNITEGDGMYLPPEERIAIW